MSLTLLLDLDDTLLQNQIDSFTSVYLKALAKHLSPWVEPEKMVPALMAATQKMIENQDPSLTLEQVFDQNFYPAIGIRRPEIQHLIDTFYAEVYPALQKVTQPRPEAIEVVRQAVQLEYRVIVATNPLFPATAITQRLGWAGVPVDQVPYHLVTSYETFHFAKPNPAFFTEVLAQIGWPESPAIMVGNDPENDTQPAAQAGLFTYLLTKTAHSQTTLHSDGIGGLINLLDWSKAVDKQNIKRNQNEPSVIMATLKATPAALDRFARQISPSQWKWQSGPGEWSLTEIVCHLRDAAVEVDAPRLEKVIHEQNPFIPGMVTDVWAEERDYQSQDGPQALRDFTASRQQLIHTLERLAPADWDRPARHAIFGPTTLRELMGFIATHDRSHIQQSYLAFQDALRQAV